MIVPAVTPLSRRAFMTLALFSISLRPPLAAAVTLDEFMELSERLLGRRGLDREIGRVYLDAISADADDAVTLAYLVQSNGNPTPEQRALSATLIAWWYTGVYTVHGTRRIATHRGALSWTALGLTAPWFRGW
jgi:hypothetical protein